METAALAIIYGIAKIFARLSIIRKLLFCLICLLLTLAVHAQNMKSLDEDISNIPKDPMAVDSLIRLSWNNKYNNDNLALDYAQSAFRISKAINYSKGIISSSNYLGQQYEDWSSFPRAVSFFQTGLNTAEKINSNKDIVMFYLLIGQVFDDEKEYEDAIQWNNRALEKAKELNDSLDQSRAYGNLAALMDKTGHLDSAYQFNLAALAYLAHGIGEASDSAVAYNNLALNQKRQHLYGNALKYLTAARELLNAKDTFSLQIWYDNMGSLYTAMDKLKDSKLMLDTALSLRSIVNSNYINADLYNNISRYYEAKKDYANALLWFKKSTKIYDTIHSNEQKRQFAALQIQYNVAEKELQLARQQAKLKEQHKLNLITVIGLIFVLALAFLLLLNNRKRKKTNVILSEKNDEISLQQARLEEVNRVKDKLFSIISHDLKSPMESLRYYLSMMGSDKLTPEDIREMAGELKYHFQHTRTLMDNLLYWASTQIKGWQLHLQNVKLHELVEETLSIIHSDASRKNIRLANQLDENLTAYTDPNLLKLALRNIFSNAVKFTPEGGNISIKGNTEESFIRLAISDTGIGIPEEKLKQFKEGIPIPNQPGTKQEKGTGLGVLVSRQFLEKQGGNMRIESEVGKGTTVYLELPAKENVTANNEAQLA